MHITTFVLDDEVFVNFQCIFGYAFKILTLWVKSALLPVICATFGRLQDKSVHFCRIECLSPKHFMT